MSSTAFNFMPTATAVHIERPRIEPGEYRATCTAVKQPQMYRDFHRWYMRVDFAIHDDGAVVSQYLNLGTGKEANFQLGPRTNYYKLWALAAGRKPEKNEPMDPALIVGAEFMVTVGDKQRDDDGVAYSSVESVRRELEALLLCGSVAPLLSGSGAPLLNGSGAPLLNGSGAQVQTDVAEILHKEPSGTLDKETLAGDIPQDAEDQRETVQSTPPPVPLTPSPKYQANSARLHAIQQPSPEFETAW